MSFTLPPLPFDKNALAPHMSAETFDFHHGKHHNAYVVKLNELVAGTAMEKQSLEDIMNATYGDDGKAAIYNNAAQIWNHTFFWNSLSPHGGGDLPTELAEKINQDFGSVEKFKEEFTAAAMGQFGSGWAWLTLKNGKLKITKTANAINPMNLGETPLLTCDVWEHAYYIDHRNSRPNFVKSFLDNMANWEFAAQNLKQGLAQAA